MVYVGIDWSDTSHDVCIINMEGNRLAAFKISHNQRGFENIHLRISRYAPSPSEAPIGIETRDSLLVDFLSEAGYTLYFLNPKQTDSFRDRHRMSHSKSDSFDAYVLADALRTDKHKFNALSPLDAESLTLRVLCRARTNVVRRKVSIHNELTAALKRYFPVAVQLFSGLDNPLAIAFLSQYTSYQQACTVSQARIAAIMVKHGVANNDAKERASSIRRRLDEPQPIPAPNVAAAFPLAVKSLLRQMENTLTELQEIEESIKDLYRNHPNKVLVESLPGVASVLGPIIASEIGADISRYSSLRTLRAYAGTSPVTQASGKFRGVHFRRACNQQHRHALHLAAATAIRTQPWARTLYDRLRSAGKSYGRALRAVADQLVEMLYAILTRRTPYDANYHSRMQAMHGRLKLHA